MPSIRITTAAVNLKNYVPVEILKKINKNQYLTVLARCGRITQKIRISIKVLYNTIMDLRVITEEDKIILRNMRDCPKKQKAMVVNQHEYEECIGEIA